MGAGRSVRASENSFFLRFMEEMNILEIAGATGLTEGAVNVHLFRAVRAVRKQLGKNND